MLWNQLKQKAGRRVVVTGMGCITPLGNNPQTAFDGLLTGKCGIVKLTESYLPQVDEMPVKIGGIIDFDYQSWYKIMPSHRVPQNAHSFASAYQALQDADYKAITENQQERFGLITGVGTSAGRYSVGMNDKFYRANQDFGIVPNEYVDNTDIHGIATVISRYFNTKGPIGTVTAACATGQAVIQQAYRNIILGEADVMVAASAQQVLIPWGIRGFSFLGAINTKQNDNPKGAAKPLDEKRQGLVAADGGNAVVLEDLEHALKRGAKIYGQLTGFSMNCDGYHLTRPTAAGEGIYRTMKNSLQMAGVSPNEVSAVNAHAAGTREGDLAEAIGIHRLFGEHKPYVTGCKGNTGHMMCTVGTFHCIESLLCIQHGTVPPIKNMTEPIVREGMVLNYVRDQPVKDEIKHVVMNNVGFGGINSSLLVSKFEG